MTLFLAGVTVGFCVGIAVARAAFRSIRREERLARAWLDEVEKRVTIAFGKASQ